MRSTHRRLSGSRRPRARQPLVGFMLVTASPLLLVLGRGALAAAAAEAGEEGAASADVKHVGVEVDDPLHVLVRLHLGTQLERLVAKPREDQRGDDRRRSEDWRRVDDLARVLL